MVFRNQSNKEIQIVKNYFLQHLSNTNLSAQIRTVSDWREVFESGRNEMEGGNFVSDCQKSGIVFPKLRSQQNLETRIVGYVVVKTWNREVCR